VTVRVLLFGHYRDAVEAAGGDASGALQLELPPGATVRDVADALTAREPRLGDLLARTRVAVRAEFADPETPLEEGDEVAFLPPMSGG
jgi:Molybdopterin converting factor, small subunit